MKRKYPQFRWFFDRIGGYLIRVPYKKGWTFRDFECVQVGEARALKALKSGLKCEKFVWPKNTGK